MAEPLLAVAALRKAYGGLVAVDDVSLELAPSSLLALIGPNGGGKSTLVALIAGELAPDAGHVRLAGRDITRAPAWKRARAGLGRGFQIPRLPRHGTVLDQALLGAMAAGREGPLLLRDPARHGPSRRRAAEALDRVGLGPLAKVPVTSLTHGQKRRLEIGMVLAAAPRLLLLDEPLAGLGPEESAELVPLLAALKTHHAILLVEHDMDAVFTLADHLAVLVEGRLVACGRPEAVREEPLVRAAYLGGEPAHA
jgi:branched-chain amino acid transport system ATP-binding protein